VATKLERLWETKTKDDEWWASFFASPLAVLFNWVVVEWKFLTPNRLTSLSFFVGFIAAGLIICGGTTNFVIAAILLNLSFVFDCMDGQMARYRGISSAFGSYYDKVSDNIKIFLFFSAAGFAAYKQTHDVTVIFLAFTGVSFYYLRGYVKYLNMSLQLKRNPNYLVDYSKTLKANSADQNRAGLGAGFVANLIWFLKDQRKFFYCDEAGFVFIISFGLIFDQLTLILWFFAVGQIFFGLLRCWQRGLQIYYPQRNALLEPMKK